MKKLILGLTMATLVSSVHMDMVEALDKKPADYTKSIKDPTSNLKDALDADTLKLFYGQVECIWRGLEVLAKEYIKAAETTEKDIKKKYQKEDDCSYAQRYCTLLRLEAEMMKKLATALKAISEGTLDILKSDPRSMKDKKFQNGVCEFDMGASWMKGVATTGSQASWHLLKMIADTKTIAPYYVDLRGSQSTKNLDSLNYKELLKNAAGATAASRQLAATTKRSSNATVRLLSAAFENLSPELDATVRLIALGSEGTDAMTSYLKNPKTMPNNNQQLERALAENREPGETGVDNGARDTGRRYGENLGDVGVRRVDDKDNNYRGAPQLTRTDPRANSIINKSAENVRGRSNNEPNTMVTGQRQRQNEAEQRREKEQYLDSTRNSNRTSNTPAYLKDDGYKPQSQRLPDRKADASWYDGGSERYDNEAYRIKTAEQMGRTRYTEESEWRKDPKRK